MISYRMPLEGLKVSTNKIYAGIHWAKRKEIKDGFLNLAVIFCRPVQRVESYPVRIHYRFVFASRGLDTLNTAFMAKMLEDSFRTIGILEEDDPAHVAETILEVVVLPKKKRSKGSDDERSKDDAKDEDFVEINISEYGSQKTA